MNEPEEKSDLQRATEAYAAVSALITQHTTMLTSFDAMRLLSNANEQLNRGQAALATWSKGSSMAIKYELKIRNKTLDSLASCIASLKTAITTQPGIHEETRGELLSELDYVRDNAPKGAAEGIAAMDSKKTVGVDLTRLGQAVRERLESGGLALDAGRTKAVSKKGRNVFVFPGKGDKTR